MSDDDNALLRSDSDVLPLLGEVWQRNLTALLAQHFGGTLSAMADASNIAEQKSVEQGEESPGKIGISTLSRWTNGKALVDRLNKIDIQIRNLGLPGVNAHSLVRGVGGAQPSPLQQELLQLLLAAPVTRLRGLMPLLRVLLATEPDPEEVRTEVELFLSRAQMYAGMDQGIQTVFRHLAGLVSSPAEQKILQEEFLEHLDHLTKRINHYNQR